MHMTRPSQSLSVYFRIHRLVTTYFLLMPNRIYGGYDGEMIGSGNYGYAVSIL